MQLEASRRCLPGGSSDSAATTVQPPVAPKHLTGGPPAHMVVRDNGDIEIETNDIMLDAHEEVDYVEEHGPALVNSGSFINRISCHRWSHIETSMFYRVISSVFWQGALQHHHLVVDGNLTCSVLRLSSGVMREPRAN